MRSCREIFTVFIMKKTEFLLYLGGEAVLYVWKVSPIQFTVLLPKTFRKTLKMTVSCPNISNTRLSRGK